MPSHRDPRADASFGFAFWWEERYGLHWLGFKDKSEWLKTKQKYKRLDKLRDDFGLSADTVLRDSGPRRTPTLLSTPALLAWATDRWCRGKSGGDDRGREHRKWASYLDLFGAAVSDAESRIGRDQFPKIKVLGVEVQLAPGGGYVRVDPLLAVMPDIASHWQALAQCHQLCVWPDDREVAMRELLKFLAFRLSAVAATPRTGTLPANK